MGFKKYTLALVALLIFAMSAPSLAQVSRWRHTHRGSDHIGAISTEQDITTWASSTFASKSISLDASTGDIYASGSIYAAGSGSFNNIFATDVFIGGDLWASGSISATGAIVTDAYASAPIYFGDGSALTGLSAQGNKFASEAFFASHTWHGGNIYASGSISGGTDLDISGYASASSIIVNNATVVDGSQNGSFQNVNSTGYMSATGAIITDSYIQAAVASATTVQGESIDVRSSSATIGFEFRQGNKWSGANEVDTVHAVYPISVDLPSDWQDTYNPYAAAIEGQVRHDGGTSFIARNNVTPTTGFAMIGQYGGTTNGFRIRHNGVSEFCMGAAENNCAEFSSTNSDGTDGDATLQVNDTSLATITHVDSAGTGDDNVIATHVFIGNKASGNDRFALVEYTVSENDTASPAGKVTWRLLTNNSTTTKHDVLELDGKDRDLTLGVTSGIAYDFISNGNITIDGGIAAATGSFTTDISIGDDLYATGEVVLGTNTDYLNTLGVYDSFYNVHMLNQQNTGRGLMLVNDYNGDAAPVAIKFQKVKQSGGASQAANAGTNVGTLSFNGPNDAGTVDQIYAQITVDVADPSAGVQEGRIELSVAQGGSLTEYLQLDGENESVDYSKPMRLAEVNVLPTCDSTMSFARVGLNGGAATDSVHTCLYYASGSQWLWSTDTYDVVVP